MKTSGVLTCVGLMATVAQASTDAADKTVRPYDSIVAHKGKDCTGNALVSTFNDSVKTSTGHCFQYAGQSFSDLKAEDLSCSRGYVTAYSGGNCDGNALYSENVGAYSAACHNVPGGFKSYRVGCVF